MDKAIRINLRRVQDPTLKDDTSRQHYCGGVRRELASKQAGSARYQNKLANFEQERRRTTAALPEGMKGKWKGKEKVLSRLEHCSGGPGMGKGKGKEKVFSTKVGEVDEILHEEDEGKGTAKGKGKKEEKKKKKKKKKKDEMPKKSVEASCVGAAVTEMSSGAMVPTKARG
ncbi:hypothetical protein C0995_016213, partial [Termitomyces sp. Mi166